MFLTLPLFSMSDAACRSSVSAVMVILDSTPFANSSMIAFLVGDNSFEATNLTLLQVLEMAVRIVVLVLVVAIFFRRVDVSFAPE